MIWSFIYNINHIALAHFGVSYVSIALIFTKVVLSYPFVTKRDYDGMRIQMSPPRRKILSVVLVL